MAGTAYGSESEEDSENVVYSGARELSVPLRQLRDGTTHSVSMITLRGMLMVL
jgi:hypothetical protein